MNVPSALFASAPYLAATRELQVWKVPLSVSENSQFTLIKRKWGKPIVCNDGVTIAKEFDLEDAEENLGAQMIREAAERTGDDVGDGTSTATVLAHAILAEGVRNLAAGASAVDLKLVYKLRSFPQCCEFLTATSTTSVAATGKFDYPAGA